MSDPNSQKSVSPLVIIFLTVFLSMLGVTIILPILPAIFEGETALFANRFDQQESSLLYGALIISYSLMQFIGAPMLGALSDRLGRKPVLLMTNLGALIGYLLFGYSLTQGWLWMLFVSRMIPGFMGGNVAVALSSIADISDEDSKAKNFGLVGAAFGIGFIIGPSIGGLLAGWGSLATPFWFTAILLVFNLILIYFFYPETNKNKIDREITPLQAIKNIQKIRGMKNLSNTFLVVMLVSFGFSFFTQFFAIYLYREFAFSVRDVGWLFGWVGFWLALTQGVIIRYITVKFSSEQILSISILFVGIFILMLLLPTQKWMFYMVQPLIAISYGLTNPNLTAMVSKLAKPEQQGEILGLNQSMSSLGQIIPPMIGGYLAGINATWPIIASAVLMATAWMVFFTKVRKKIEN